METDVSHEYQEYLNEFRILQEAKLLDEYLDEIEENSYRSCDEGEQEADWLRAAGLPHLTEPFSQGRELAEHELEPALRLLPKHQAEAVKRRVRTLNHTVRKRAGRQHRARQRKPDIRDVFKDIENSSTGTRSRSATPDSLDSELPCEEPAPQLPWSYTEGPLNRNITNITVTADGQYQSYRSQPKEIARRQPSTSPSDSYGPSILFRHPGAWGGGKGSLASDSGGVEILHYQPIGTLHLPRPRERIRSGSDPTTHSSGEENYNQYQYHKPVIGSPPTSKINPADWSKLLKNTHTSITRSHSNLYNIEPHVKENGHQRLPAARPPLRRTGSHGHLGFEDAVQHKYQPFTRDALEKIKSSLAFRENAVGRTWVEYLGEEDLSRLRPLLLMDVTALFDTHNIAFHKRKPPKRKRKEEGNVFGVSLATLLMKDNQLAPEEVLVPLVIQKLLSHAERHGLREEGILRVPGLEQKVEALRNELENEFYRRPERVDQLMQHVSCHDIMAVLKRFIRDLPQPLLTVEYIDMFYQSHALPEGTQQRALNLLILLLPSEYRNTLRAIFTFLLHVIENQAHNKMTQHNVAMLFAPSLFIPRYVHPVDKNDLNAQVNLAATCCQLTEVMLQCGESLWIVPEDLIAQIRCQKEEERYRKGHKENNKPMKRLLGKKGATREPITRKIDNEVDFQDGVIRVNAPQFQMSDVPVQLSPETTAGDVVLRIAEEATRRSEVPKVSLKFSRRPQDIKSRALAELAPNGNLSCFLATGYPEMTLQTHYLYEIGGNIAQRQVEHNANLLAVYKENPNAQWTLRCHHRHANNAVPVH
ncbi:rho GTPase-activating protein conundrum [Anabrus simplex]|uniref:rho GTPase-activating protein conundrum n=1 Tax=Anabrus simplex TaxID=316456 RepID=UPI0035A2E536